MTSSSSFLPLFGIDPFVNFFGRYLSPHHGPSCLIPEWNINGFMLTYPTLLLASGLGVATGFLGFYFITHFKGVIESRHMYALTFFFFGCMNTMGLLTHCVFYGNFSRTAYWWVGYWDGVFSSCCSISFFFCWLFDFKILKWGSLASKISLSLTYLGITVAYWFGYKDHIYIIFKILYIDATAYSTLSFFIMELVWLGMHRTSKGIGFLAFAFVLGIFGVRLYSSPWAHGYFCNKLGVYWPLEVIWYFISDLCMITLLTFYFKSHPGVSINHNEDHDGQDFEMQGLVEEQQEVQPTFFFVPAKQMDDPYQGTEMRTFA